jgi:hypothetical protein
MGGARRKKGSLEADKRYTQYVGHSKKEHTKAPQATYTGRQRGAD